MPKVSIVIPVYNVEKYLPQCLDSVINQTLEDIEIICINDCSPDNSIKILNEYAEKDSRIKVIDLKENGGVSNARNIAMDAAQGKYIMCLDPDDWYEPDACETAYLQIENNNNDFVVFGLYNYYEETGQKVFSTKTRVFKSIIGISQATVADIENVFRASAEVWYKIYRKNFLKENNIKLDSRSFEGQTWNIRIYAYAKSFSYIDKPLYNYRVRNDSLTSISTNWENLIDRKEAAYEMFKEFDFPNKQKVQAHYIIFLVNTILLFFKRFGDKLDIETKNLFYNEAKRFLTILDSENDIKAIKDNIDYSTLKAIIKYRNYWEYNIFYSIKNKLFSVKNGKHHIEICFWGIKLSLKKRKIGSLCKI